MPSPHRQEIEDLREALVIESLGNEVCDTRAGLPGACDVPALAVELRETWQATELGDVADADVWRTIRRHLA